MEEYQGSRNDHRINLKGAIRIDYVENILNSLMSKLDAQDLLIQKLFAQCEQYQSALQANEQFQVLHNMYSTLQTQLTQLSSATYCKVGSDKMIPANELTLINSIQLNQIVQQLKTFAVKADMDQQHMQTTQLIGSEIQRVFEYSAAANDLNKLNANNEQLCVRMRNLEQLCANKIDRTELSNLQAVSATLQEFRTFKERMGALVPGLEQQIRACSEKLLAAKQSIESSAGQLSRLSDECAKFALKSEVKTVANQIQECSELLGLKADEESLRQISQLLKITVNEVNDTSKNKLALIRSELESMRGAIATKAENSRLDHFVLAVRYEEDMDAIRKNVDIKVDIGAFTSLTRGFEELAHKVDVESEKTVVALRFVEWFTDRGVMQPHHRNFLSQKLHDSALGLDGEA